MSHQTGIKSNSRLRQTMAEAKFMGNNIRLFKVVINVETEELELADGNGANVYLIKGDWQADFKSYAHKLVSVNEPCYIFFRMDSTNDSGFNDWTFILYSPEYSNVRKKMLYASTKSTLKNEFGTGILYDYFADSEDSLTLESFQKWIEEKQKLSKGDDEDADVDEDFSHDAHSRNGAGLLSSNDLLTPTEDERRKVKTQEYELSLEKNPEKKSAQFQFPLRPEAINALLDFRDNHIVYLKLKVNLQSEEIQLDTKVTGSQHPVLVSTIDLQNEDHQKKALLPANPAAEDQDGNIGFHIFSFVHLDPEGSRTQKTVFVFVMPTEKTTVRQRISYSACLNSLFDSITNRINIPIDKRIEVDSVSEVTVELVASKLYPELDKVKAVESNNAEAAALKFTKPRGPPGRGPRRMIK